MESLDLDESRLEKAKEASAKLTDFFKEHEMGRAGEIVGEKTYSALDVIDGFQRALSKKYLTNEAAFQGLINAYEIKGEDLVTAEELYNGTEALRMDRLSQRALDIGNSILEENKG